MKLLSVNTGKARAFDNEMGRTGIFKKPVSGPVRIHRLGVGDDDICNLRVHGGPDQAVYIYGQPDYEYWESELGRALTPGLFGENLTIAGFESDKMMVGDRLEIGDVLLELTAPRVPCATFAAVMGDTAWAKRFFEAKRPGVYARVLNEGSVSAGDAVTHIPFVGEKIPANDLLRDTHNPAPERMRQLLKAPIHTDLRAHYEQALAQQAQQQQQ